MLNRRSFMKIIGMGTAAVGLSGCASGMAGKGAKGGKPNVILVITDDQGYGDIGAHGNKVIKTPNLDTMYQDSVRLKNYHVGPTCAPTRAGLLTGHYCNSTGVWHTIMGRSLLRKDEITLGDVFRDGGYKTAMFGKWHLGDNYPFRPEERGFDHVLRHGGGGVIQLPDYWGNSYFNDTYWLNGKPTKYKGYCTDVWFDGAIEFIETNRKRPFFVYLATNAPHGPFLVDEEYSDMYKGNKDVPNVNFYGMITNIDDNMAKLRKKLKELGLEENTILIFTTDNGTAAGFRGGKGFNAGMKGTKGSEFDGGHRVPLFVHWPKGGMTGGKDVEKLTAHIDMMPTLMELCGIKNSREVDFHGKSIVPLLKGKESSWPDRVIVTDSQRLEEMQKWRKSAVMTEQYRLVNGQGLYDINADPGQVKDLAKEKPEVVKRLRAEYEKWWKLVAARADEYVPIILGNPKDNPARLTSHDWHGNGSLSAWNQGQIRGGPMVNGFWVVDVEAAGKYEFSLRRWPLVVDAPITAAADKGKAIKATKARLKIGDIDQTKDIPKDAKEVKFTLDLNKGETKMQTWFLDGDNPKSRGAYFVYAKKL